MSNRLLVAAALLAGAGSAWALLPAVHHAEPAPGVLPTPVRLTVTGAIIDPSAPGDAGALNLELYGEVVLGQAPGHAGYTLCQGRCQIAPPLRSWALVAGPDTRLIVAGTWVPPAGAVARIDAGSLLLIRGALDAPAGLRVDVTGIPGALPAVLLSAGLILGTITAGDLPAGTALEVTATHIYLVEE